MNEKEQTVSRDEIRRAIENLKTSKRVLEDTKNDKDRSVARLDYAARQLRLDTGKLNLILSKIGLECFYCCFLNNGNFSLTIECR